MKSIYQKVLGLGVLLGGLIASSPAIAADTLVHLGTTSEGKPIFLDTEETRGTRFSIVMSYGNGMKKMQYKASCAEKRLFRRKVELITASGRIASTDRKSKEVKYSNSTAAGRGMKIVCQDVGAKGW